MSGAFTDQAHNLILLAGDETRMLGRSVVEPEHLLLALSRHGTVRSQFAALHVQATVGQPEPHRGGHRLAERGNVTSNADFSPISAAKLSAVPGRPTAASVRRSSDGRGAGPACRQIRCAAPKRSVTRDHLSTDTTTEGPSHASAGNRSRDHVV